MANDADDLNDQWNKFDERLYILDILLDKSGLTDAKIDRLATQLTTSLESIDAKPVSANVKANKVIRLLDDLIAMIEVRLGGKLKPQTSQSTATAPTTTTTAPITATTLEDTPLPVVDGSNQQFTNEKRLPDGTLNLHFVDLGDGVSTEFERRVKLVWPHAMTQAQAARHGQTKATNKVSFPQRLKLRWVNNEVLSNLEELQSRLVDALIPYELWPKKVVFMLDGDFCNVRDYTMRFRITWFTFLEAIIQTLDKHNALQAQRLPSTTPRIALRWRLSRCYPSSARPQFP